MVENFNIEAVEKPRGIYPARVDDKGRLKLPVDIQRYFQQIGAEKLFITSLDERVGRIYPIPLWRQNEALIQAAGEDEEAGVDLWFAANDLGADAEMDNQGRLLMPVRMRKVLEIEDQPVYLQHVKGHVRIYSEPVYLEMQQRSRENRAEKLKIFEKKGLL